MALSNKTDDFCCKLRQRKIDGSLAAAKGTAELLRQLVTSIRVGDPRDLLDEVRTVGVKLQAARPAGTNAGMHILSKSSVRFSLQ